MEKHLRSLDLGEILAGIWFRFEDRNGLGWAQPDVLCIQKEKLYVIECKRTQAPDDASRQLLGLYAPLAREVFPGRACILLHTFRYPSGGSRPQLRGPRALQARELLPEVVLDWHLRI